MEPVDQRLILIQDEIRESFGWDLQSDYESAKSLVSKCKNPIASVNFESKVTVVGAAAESEFKTYLMNCKSKTKLMERTLQFVSLAVHTSKFAVDCIK